MLVSTLVPAKQMTGHSTSTTLRALSTDNDAATLETLAQMRAAVRGEIGPDFAGWRDERIRLKAEELLRGVPPGFENEVGRLFTFARDGVTYRHDQVDTQRVQDAWQTITRGSGKCVDKVIALAALLAAMGYVSRFVVQRTLPGEDWSHVYLEAFDEKRNQWVPLDPTGEGMDGRPLVQMGWKQPAHDENSYEIFEGLNMLGDLTNDYGFGFSPGGGIDWNAIIHQGIETAGNVAGANWGGPYYASTNAGGHYPLDAFGRPYNPQTGALIQNPNVAAASANQFGTQFNIPWWGWALVGIVAVSFLRGKGKW